MLVVGLYPWMDDVRGMGVGLVLGMVMGMDMGMGIGSIV